MCRRISVKSCLAKSSGTHESGGVIVFDGFRIPESFEDGISLQELLFEFSLRQAKDKDQVHDHGNVRRGRREGAGREDDEFRVREPDTYREAGGRVLRATVRKAGGAAVTATIATDEAEQTC